MLSGGSLVQLSQTVVEDTDQFSVVLYWDPTWLNNRVDADLPHLSNTLRVLRHGTRDGVDRNPETLR